MIEPDRISQEQFNQIAERIMDNFKLSEKDNNYSYDI